MKQILSLAFLVFSFCTAMAQEQQLSPRTSVKNSDIEVTHGQPSKRGRVIFGDLVPYGEVWRTGANEATEITFKKNVNFAGKPVKAGTYSLFTIPKQKEWVVILNSKTGQWGAYDYESIKSNNVVQVTVPTYSTNNTVEKLTFALKDNSLNIEWDKTGVSIPISK